MIGTKVKTRLKIVYLALELVAYEMSAAEADDRALEGSLQKSEEAEPARDGKIWRLYR
jgi:hypothetical protein